MTQDSIEVTGAAKTAELIRTGALSATEVVRASLERIEMLGEVTCPVVDVAGERALVEAELVDAGRLTGRLAGVPFTVKEMTDTEGLLTELGSRACQGRRPTTDAEVVRRMRAEGAILVAKTSSPEFALRPTTEGELHAATRNAWNPDYGSGGSSGGAAVSVATGMVPVALGSDGGGSIRIPAACNGVAGLKPSRARVPGAPGSYEAWAGFSVDGPIAREVIDLALTLEVISGPTVGDPYAVHAGPMDFVEAARRGREEQRSLRIAFTTQAPHGQVQPLIAGYVEQFGRDLAGMGHDVVEGSPDLTGLYEPFLTIVRGNAGALRQVLADEQLGQLEGSTLSFIMRGIALSAAEYCHAVDTVRAMSARIVAFWQDYDLLVTPVITHLPRRLGKMPASYELDARWEEYMAWQAFTYPFNVTGQPAIALPAGVDLETGLPIAVQTVAAPGQEALLLEVASSLEAHRPWPRTAPHGPPGQTQPETG